MVNWDNLSMSFTEEFNNFVANHPAYGYGRLVGNLNPAPNVIHRIRQQDYSRLHPSADAQPHGITPLDHAGSALYAESQLKDVFRELQTSMLQNPHSASQAGALPTQHRQELAQLTLEMCNASPQDYEVVLTAGATASMKLVAESLPWGQGSQLLYLRQTHNSVLGMREYVLRAGGSVQVADLADNSVQSNTRTSLQDAPTKQPGIGRNPNQPPFFLKAVTPAMSRAHHCQQQTRPGFNGTCGGMAQNSKDSPSVDGLSDPANIHLAVLPHECNFTGQRLNLELVNTIQSGPDFLLPAETAVEQHVHDTLHQQCRHHYDHDAQDAQPGTNQQTQTAQSPRRWLVMLDAAKSCSTGPPDLSLYPADLVALSYYKIFGYPTGLGALLVRKELLPIMTAQKPYFGGGTVAASCAEEDWFARRPGTAGLEDGTQAFTSIAAARHGFKYFRQLGWFPAIQAHTRALADYLVTAMASLRHPNNQPLVVFYGRPNKAHAVDDINTASHFPGIESWGPTVTFNLKRADGSWIGYNEVSQLATLHGIHLRVGCFCNPGACAKYLNLSGAEMRENYEAGHVCWDERDIMHGKPTGAVRVSLGHISMFQDVHYFVRFLQHYFLAGSKEGLSAGQEQQAAAGLLTPIPEPETLVRATGSQTSSISMPDTQKRDTSPTLHAKNSPVTVADGHAPNTSESLSNELQIQQQQSYLGRSGLPENCQHGNRVVQAAGNSSSQTSTNETNNWNGLHHREEVVSVSQSQHEQQQQQGSQARLSAMYVYPIKSCAAQQVTQWPVGATGLLYDREWALVDDQGKVITQKACPQAALIVPHIDLTTNTLTISAPSSVFEPLVIPLGTSAQQSTDNNAARNNLNQQQPVLINQPVNVSSAMQAPGKAVKGVTNVSVCGDQVCGSVAVSEHLEGSIRAWFKAAIGTPCTLVRQQSGQRAARPGTGGTGRYSTAERQKMLQQAADSQNGQMTTTTTDGPDARALIGFANDGQFLLVNAASVQDVNDRMQSITKLPQGGEFKPVDVNRFRPNLVITGLQPFAEDEWKHVQVGSLKFDVLGTCPRCEMLQVDQKNGTRGRPDVLLALAQYRRFNGRMHFGILLSSAQSRDAARDSPDDAKGSNSTDTLLLRVGDVITGHA